MENPVGMLEVWRTLLTFAALIGCGLNISLAFGVFKNKSALPYLGVWYAYTVAAALTLGVSIYWRGAGFPLNPGDFTALIPIGGFLTAGLLGTKTLGKRVVDVEVDQHLRTER